MRLDRKTYCMKFGLEMFICKRYNKRGTYDMHAVFNGWKEARRVMTGCRMQSPKVG